MTEENYREMLTPLLTAGEGQGICISLAVEVSSLDLLNCAANSACFGSTR